MTTENTTKEPETTDDGFRMNEWLLSEESGRKFAARYVGNIGLLTSIQSDGTLGEWILEVYDMMSDVEESEEMDSIMLAYGGCKSLEEGQSRVTIAAQGYAASLSIQLALEGLDFGFDPNDVGGDTDLGKPTN